MQELIGKLFRWAFDNPALNKLDDQAVVQIDRNATVYQHRFVCRGSALLPWR